MHFSHQTLRKILIFLQDVSTLAPKNNLEILKSLTNNNCRSAKVALEMLASYLWYLSEKLVALALHPNVTFEEKRAMIAALQTDSKKPAKQVAVDVTH